jgi:hypothetical protein
MITAYFERTDRTNPSLTLLASSGPATQAALNTTNTGLGTQSFSIQLNGTNIEAKAVSGTVSVAVRVCLFN